MPQYVDGAQEEQNAMSKVKVLSRAKWRIGRRLSIALCHACANAVKATAGGWSTGSSVSLTFPLHFHMTRPGLEPTTYRL